MSCDFLKNNTAIAKKTIKPKILISKTFYTHHSNIYELKQTQIKNHLTL